MTSKLTAKDSLIGSGRMLQERYLVEDELGQGGMGIVFQAVDTLLERPVAIKILSKTDPSGDERERLLIEAKAAAQLNHPNVVAIHDAGEFRGIPYIVMEMVDGKPLSVSQKVSIEETVRIALDICRALDHAHQHGIIHRDLKPENIMITSTGSVKLLDFGLARMSGRSRLTREGDLIGTLAYMAPELILGQPVSVASDLYALGVILYELSAARPPFEGDNAGVLLSNHLHAPVVPPSAHNPDIPPQLESIILRLLNKDPERRPPSAAEVLDLLMAIGGPSLVTPQPISGTSSVSMLERIASGRLVGRESELAAASQLWLRALSGQAGLLLVSGEPGIGKTRFVQAIIAQARIAGAEVLSGGCYEFEASTPYLPLTEALGSWVQNQDQQTLAANLDANAAELARLAPEIDTRLGPLPSSPALGAEEQRLRLFDNVAQFLGRLAGDRGLLLFVDDLHWADKGTIALISYLVRRLRSVPLLIIAAYREVELDRTHPLAEAMVQWTRQRLAVRVQLARFNRDETKALISTLFWREKIDEGFAELIHKETDGNPFFIEEVAKSLVEQGQIYWAGDRWERDELTELAIPQSIKEAIGRRLNGLTDDCIEILHTAAVIGKDFPYELLESVTDQGEERLLDALEEAISAQLIRQSGGESFVFTHDKIREVLYQEILSIRRNRLHLQIARSLELSRNGGSTTRVEDLAYHYITAGELESGMKYALRAAERAEHLFAGDEALLYLKQALECARSLGDQLTQSEILEKVGDIYSDIGPLASAVQNYQHALELNPERNASIKIKIGLVFNITNDDRGIPLLHEALEELDPESEPVEVASALTALGRFHHYRCQYGKAIELYSEAGRLTKPYGDPETLSRIYASLAGSYQHLAQLENSLGYAQESIKTGEKYDYFPAVALGHEFIGENNLIMGYWERSLEAAQVDKEIGQKIGSANRTAWGIWISGHALYGSGRLIESVARIEEALDRAIAIGETRLSILCNLSLSQALAEIGDESAFERIDQARETSEKMVELYQRSYIDFVSGYASLQFERLDDAMTAFQDSEQITESTELVDILLYRLPYHAECHLLRSNLDTAENLLRQSIQLCQKVGAVHYEGVAHRVQGQLLIKQEDYGKADDSLRQAETLFRKTGSMVELGRALYQKASLKKATGDPGEAGKYADLARQIFSDCSARRELEKVNDLLAQI